MAELKYKTRGNTDPKGKPMLRKKMRRTSSPIDAL